MEHTGDASKYRSSFNSNNQSQFRAPVLHPPENDPSYQLCYYKVSEVMPLSPGVVTVFSGGAREEAIKIYRKIKPMRTVTPGLSKTLYQVCF